MISHSLSLSSLGSFIITLLLQLNLVQTSHGVVHCVPTWITIQICASANYAALRHLYCIIILHYISSKFVAIDTALNFNGQHLPSLLRRLLSVEYRPVYLIFNILPQICRGIEPFCFFESDLTANDPDNIDQKSVASASSSLFKKRSSSSELESKSSRAPNAISDPKKSSGLQQPPVVYKPVRRVFSVSGSSASTVFIMMIYEWANSFR